ncbi:CoA ester lyase [Phenylobacterium sp.]|uniref:HpcH/HpaI aldolase/citrate lyase family protein n=1 Tax=Phenylobacterium sp. TaxID=1871053 RepID=UPI00301D5341
MSALRPRRSALYMPAANARAIEKSRSLDCDVVILDLEDAVAPEAKAEARRQAVDAVQAGGFGRREVVIRVNGLDTPWGADDLAAAAAARPDAILAPKVSSPEDVAAYAAASGDCPLWAMIETCGCLFRLDAIAAAARNTPLTAWVIGTNDLAKEMRCRLDVERRPLQAALSLAVAAARAEGLVILDGVYNALEDDAGLERQCRQGVEFGFDGKTLIHPRQVPVANTVFTPTEDEVRWARTVVDAFAQPENAGKGVLRVEGRMVERLHLEEARRALAIADAVGA